MKLVPEGLEEGEEVEKGSDVGVDMPLTPRGEERRGEVTREERGVGKEEEEIGVGRGHVWGAT